MSVRVLRTVNGSIIFRLLTVRVDGSLEFLLGVFECLLEGLVLAFEISIQIGYLR